MHHAGMVSMVHVFMCPFGLTNSPPFRCIANKANLDGSEAIQCCLEHTEEIVWAWELGKLWNEYGVIGQIVVCSGFSLLFEHDIHLFP